MDIEIVKNAITSRKPIAFEYHKSGHKTGYRRGNPHALYYHNSTKNLILDVYQTKGATSDNEKLPGWRPILMKYIKNVEILDTENEFEIAKGYNSTSDNYRNYIVKL